MSGKRKTLIGYGALIVISALFLMRAVHYRTIYGALAENLVLPAQVASKEGAPRAEAVAEFDLAQIAQLMTRREVDTQILYPSIRRAVESGLIPLEADVGVALPRTYYHELVGEVRSSLFDAINTAKYGEDVGLVLASGGYHRAKMDELRSFRDARGDWKALRPVYDALRRRFEEGSGQAEPHASE